MIEHPHLDVFGRIYDAFTDGDLDSLAAMFDEEVVWHTPGRNPLAGDYEGRDAVLASFVEEFDLSHGSYRVHVHDVLADDRHIVALLRATASRDERTLDMNYVLVFEMKDGRVAEAWESWADQRTLDEFWS
jgi:ketosteroid isomerase-like protein